MLVVQKRKFHYNIISYSFFFKKKYFQFVFLSAKLQIWRISCNFKMLILKIQ